MLGFGRDTIKEQGINKDRLWEQVKYLSNMISNMFVYNIGNYESYEEFEEVLDFMMQRKILYIENEFVKYPIPGGQANGLMFLCSMIWPFIDSYWLTLIYIHSISGNNVLESKILGKIQRFAESLYEDKIILHYESCALGTIGHAVEYFLDIGIIIKNKTTVEGGEDNTIITLHPKYQEDSDLIQKEFDKITFYKNVSYFRISLSLYMLDDLFSKMEYSLH